jgi:hypothetical protein
MERHKYNLQRDRLFVRQLERCGVHLKILRFATCRNRGLQQRRQSVACATLHRQQLNLSKLKYVK